MGIGRAQRALHVQCAQRAVPRRSITMLVLHFALSHAFNRAQRAQHARSTRTKPRSAQLTQKLSNNSTQLPYTARLSRAKYSNVSTPLRPVLCTPFQNYFQKQMLSILMKQLFSSTPFKTTFKTTFIYPFQNYFQKQMSTLMKQLFPSTHNPNIYNLIPSD